MPGDYIRPPSGSSPEARFARFTHDAITRESRLINVTGHRVSSTTQGKFIIPSSSGGRRGGASVAQFKLRLVGKDILVGRDWDGTNLGTDDILIAKYPELWCSVASETIYGDLHSYTYADDTDEPFMEFGTAVPGETYNEWHEEPTDYDSGGPLFEKRLNVVRSVVIDGITENQRVVPVWRKGMIVYAIEFDGGVTASGEVVAAGLPIEYLMLGSRMWARI